MEWNGFSRERNRMEWNLKILFECYKIKEWNGMEWKVSSSVWKWHWKEWNGMESFYNNITNIPLILKNIKNNQWELIMALKCLVFSGWCETS